jgi:hypothetical protein
MSEELTVGEHALRVGVLDVIGDEVTAVYKAARKEAEAAFAPARDDGQSQRKVILPDGTEIGLLSIRAGRKQVDVTEAALEAWTAEHLPDGMEDYLDPSALASADVLDVLRAVFPDLVKRRIRQATRTALLKEIETSGGYLVDKVTAEKEKVGEVTDLKATGAFSYRPGTQARDQVIAAWQRGDLRHLGLGALALPGAAAEPDVPRSDPGPEPGWSTEPAATDDGMPFGVFGDELGLLDPVKAAGYAVVMSNGGGFTTPPIEAYRMLRDGGIHAERARAWMQKHGLDQADPRQGRDTPWPLPAANGDAEA